MAENKDEKFNRSYLLQSFHKQYQFFARLFEELFEKTERLTNLETQKSYKHTCFSLKYWINKHNNNTDFNKSRTYCSTKNSSCWCGFAIITKSDARISISFSGTKSFTFQELRQMY